MTVVESDATWVVTRNWRSVEFSALTWAEVNAAAFDVVSAAMSVVLRFEMAVVESRLIWLGLSDEIMEAISMHSESTFCHPSP